MTNSSEKSQSLPWYKEGLRFKCTECGKCCTGTSGFVWITEDEMMGMAQALKMSLSSFKKQYTRQRDNRYALTERKNGANYDCIFLEGKKCSLYMARPKQCRTFPWWRENLNSKECWEQAAEECEGINDAAPVVSFEEIEHQVAKNGICAAE